MTSLFLLVPFFLVYALLRLLEKRICRHVAAEPPLVRARIPIIGHVLALLRWGVSYYRKLRFVFRSARLRKKEDRCCDVTVSLHKGAEIIRVSS